MSFLFQTLQKWVCLQPSSPISALSLLSKTKSVYLCNAFPFPWLKILNLAEMWSTRLLLLIYFFPTGITVDRNGFIYFVDGTMIRRIDENAVITTVIGSNGLTSTQPLSCDSGMDITQVGTAGFQALSPFGIVEMDNNFLMQKLHKKEAWCICCNVR